MTASNIQTSIPVLINVQPGIVKGSWPSTDEASTSTGVGESIPFTRPAITTGAHLPWNVHKKSSYSVPRAICSLQTVPPITLLNNRQEGTKLVYSRTTDTTDLSGPAESPFKRRSHVLLGDEEMLEQERNVESFSNAPAATAAVNVKLEKLEQLEHDHRLDSFQASTGILPPQVFAEPQPESNQQIDLPNPQAFESPQSTFPLIQSVPVEAPYPADSVKMEMTESEPQQLWLEPPVVNLDKAEVGDYLPSAPDPVVAVEAFDIGASYAAESAGPTNTRASSLYKSSGDSSALGLSEALQTPDGGEIFDGSSRSQSLTEKRKSDAIEPVAVMEPDEQTLEISQEGLKEAAILEQRAVRRRLTNRVSAMRTAEKKSQELNRMERLIERLQNEHVELQTKCKRQSKTCKDLRRTLGATEGKLKAQEDENCKLKSEMQFLRGNLAMLPQPGGDGASSALEARMKSTSGPLVWNPDFPFPTGMPTQAEIAADLELDRQLLRDAETGHEYLREWQMW